MQREPIPLSDLFFPCINLVDVQHESTETDPNDVFIGNIGEPNILSNSEGKKKKKNLYPLLAQRFASSALPLEKSKTLIQGDLWHP